METRRKVTPGGLWRSLYPVLLYLSLQMAAGFLYMIVLAAYSVFSGVEPAGLYEYLMDRYAQGGTVAVVLLSALLSLPLFSWLYCRDMRQRKQCGWKEEWYPLTEWQLLWAAVGSAALALFGNGLVAFLPLEQWADSYEEVNDALYSGSVWLRMAAVGFFGPAVEELIMRGLLYQRLRGMMRPAAAMIWSALVFGVFHGNVIQGVYAFLVGLFFAWLMERTQRILAPMLGHMAANVFIVLLEDFRVLDIFYRSAVNFLGMMLISGVVFLCAAAALKER